MCDKIFAKLRYTISYQDDGLAILHNTKQSHGSFMAELWSPPQETDTPLDEVESDEMMETTMPEDMWDKWEEKVTVVRKEEFPYLNIKLYWDKQELCFAVYNKENQHIKYVNKESCHHASVFKAIPEGVFTCLG
eukprot:12909437-Ditylum_brightwellii.AAC.1